MTPQYGHVYLADLNPRFGTEPGKVRPVVVVQTDALNPYHLSTLICPLTTQVIDVPTPLRVSIPQGRLAEWEMPGSVCQSILLVPLRL